MLAIPAWILSGKSQAAKDFLGIFVSLIRLIARLCRVILVTHRSAELECKRYLLSFIARERVRIVLVPDDLEFSVWIRDPFVICSRRGSQLICISASSFIRGSDSCFAEFLLKELGLAQHFIDLPLTGGNIVSTSTHHFIGMDHALVALAAARLRNPCGKVDLPEIKRTYERSLGGKQSVVFVGSHLATEREQKIPARVGGDVWKHLVATGNSDWTSQPIFHIDMFLTAIEQGSGLPPILLVADPGLAHKICALPSPPSHSVMFQNVFDDIASQLSSQGFRVFRCPMPIFGHVHLRQKMTSWNFASYNNCIVLGQEKHCLAILPSFASSRLPQLQRLDHFVANLFQQLGLNTCFVSNAHTLSKSLGGLRCLTNYFGGALVN